MFDAQPDFQFLAAPGEKSETVLHPAAKAKRAAIKAAGGAEYEILLAKGRNARAKFRQRNPGYWKEYDKRNGIPWKTFICASARARGRRRGLLSTITPEDLVWPSHCPVLGFELDYVERSGERGAQRAQPNWPSLDRWDNTKGYVPGNVFVISYRANSLKNSATYEEILKVAKYLSRRPK
jgi:hypothetical protein